MRRWLVHALVVAIATPGAVVWSPASAEAESTPVAQAATTQPVPYLSVAPELGAVTLHWQNPTGPDWADTVVRMLPGAVPPAGVSEGQEIYVGRGTDARVENLQPGLTYSFSAFARDVLGAVAEPASRTVPSLVVEMRPNPPVRNSGSQVLLTGRVKDSTTGQLVDHVDVQAVGIDPRTGRGVPGNRAATFAGSFQIPVYPNETSTWTVVARSRQHLGAVSKAAQVTIVSVLTIKSATRRGKAGSVFKIVAGARPVSTTQPLQLQKLVKGRWKPVAKQRPNRDCVATFRIKPSRGKHVYRVTRAGMPSARGGRSPEVRITVI